jgi:hypothetical protein
MILGLIIGVFLSLILFTIAIGVSSDIPILQIAQTIGSVVIAISSLLALSLYRQASKKQKSQFADKASLYHLNQALKFIESAYSVFTGNKVGALPLNQKLLWQTTARLIVRYENIKKFITVAKHKVILQEHDEFWRIQFNELLDLHRSSLTTAYFKGEENHHMAEINRQSIAIIFDFSSWQDSYYDSLKQVDSVELLANGAVSVDFIETMNYFKLDNDLLTKLEVRKNKLSRGGMLFLYLTVPSMLNVI